MLRRGTWEGAPIAPPPPAFPESSAIPGTNPPNLFSHGWLVPVLVQHRVQRRQRSSALQQLGLAGVGAAQLPERRKGDPDRDRLPHVVGARCGVIPCGSGSGLSWFTEVGDSYCRPPTPAPISPVCMKCRHPAASSLQLRRRSCSSNGQLRAAGPPPSKQAHLSPGHACPGHPAACAAPRVRQPGRRAPHWQPAAWRGGSLSHRPGGARRQGRHGVALPCLQAPGNPTPAITPNPVQQPCCIPCTGFVRGRLSDRPRRAPTCLMAVHRGASAAASACEPAAALRLPTRTGSAVFPRLRAFANALQGKGRWFEMVDVVPAARAVRFRGDSRPSQSSSRQCAAAAACRPPRAGQGVIVGGGDGGENAAGRRHTVAPCGAIAGTRLGARRCFQQDQGSQGQAGGQHCRLAALMLPRQRRCRPNRGSLCLV